MTLLLAFRQRKAVEPFAALIDRLAGSGHRVAVCLQERDESVARLFREPHLVELLTLPAARRDEWAQPSGVVRALRDYLQYLKAPYQGAVKLRARAFERLLKQLAAAPDAARAWSADTLTGLGHEAVRRLEQTLAGLEAAIPTDPIHDQAIERVAPDALLVSPLVHFGSSQVEIVKSARRRGIPVGMLLFSWDNLSTKGALHVPPDHLFVWNARQQQEASELHGFPEASVTIAGAPRFDGFAALTSHVTREDFCRPLQADPDTAILLYVCSSRLVSQKEQNFIRRWATAIRTAASPRLRDALIVVRPHPDLPMVDATWLSEERTFRWPGVEGIELTSRVVFGDARMVTLTSDYGAQRVLFESIHHSQAVIGLNTSAEIESGIVGRPVFTPLAGNEYADGQDTTLHFHYLLESHGGFVRSACTLDEHLNQLARELETPTPPATIRARAQAFVRPGGWDTPAAEVLANAIERVLLRGASVLPAVTSSVERAPLPDSDAMPGVRKLPGVDVRDVTRLEWKGRSIWSVGSGAVRQPDDWPASCRETLTCLGEHIGPGDVVYDLTAGAGLWAVAAARMLGCTVVAFEANLAAISTLWQNVLLNGCDGLVVPVPARAGQHTDLLQEQFSTAGPDATRRVGRRLRWREHDPVAGEQIIQPVLTLPLMWAIKRWKLPTPAALRFSLTADEPELLEAVRDLLADAPLRAVIIETHGPAGREAITASAWAGWRLLEGSTEQNSTIFQLLR